MNTPAINSATGILRVVWLLLKYIGRKLAYLGQFASVGNSADGPIISSADMLSATGLQSLAQGMAGNYLYNLLTNDSGKVMMLISLDRNTHMHIVAIGSQSGLISQSGQAISGKWLEPVSLEGDFPDHFQMYCTRGKQMETRQVFGPETMANFVDFCRAYNFELFESSVYISVAEDADDTGDSTTMVTDITDFIEHNQSVLQNI